jgi:rubrerythrin
MEQDREARAAEALRSVNKYRCRVCGRIIGPDECVDPVECPDECLDCKDSEWN